MANPLHQMPQGQSVAEPGTPPPPLEYPSRECKHDIKETEINIFNPKLYIISSTQLTEIRDPTKNMKRVQ